MTGSTASPPGGGFFPVLSSLLFAIAFFTTGKATASALRLQVATAVVQRFSLLTRDCSLAAIRSPVLMRITGRYWPAGSELSERGPGRCSVPAVQIPTAPVRRAADPWAALAASRGSLARGPVRHRRAGRRSRGQSGPETRPFPSPTADGCGARSAPNVWLCDAGARKGLQGHSGRW